LVERPTFANTMKGHERVIAWLERLPAGHVLVGIENAGGYATTLAVAPARAAIVALDVVP
jgi:hypothetical protein